MTYVYSLSLTSFNLTIDAMEPLESLYHKNYIVMQCQTILNRDHRMYALPGIQLIFNTESGVKLAIVAWHTSSVALLQRK